MLAPTALIERLLNDFECVTLAVVMETLGMPRSSAIQALLDFAQGRDNLKLIYSVFYVDENDNVILSQKSDNELEGEGIEIPVDISFPSQRWPVPYLSAGLRGLHRDMIASLLGIRKGKESCGVTQMCWRHELEIVEKELKKALENGSLYFPSYVTLQGSNIRIRNYERIKQGDSSLCTPVHKPQAIVVAPTAVPASANALRSGVQRSTVGISAFFDRGSKRSTYQNMESTAVSSDVGPGHKVTSDSRDVATPQEINTFEPGRVVDDMPQGPANMGKRFCEDPKPAVPRETSRPRKREKTLVNEDPAHKPNVEPEMSSLFDCDAPCDAMELDTQSCKDGPLTYVEKVTIENTYVDSGYFVVEETNEYVEVTAPTKAEATTSPNRDGRTLSSSENRKGLLKRPQKNLNQITLMSFFNK